MKKVIWKVQVAALYEQTGQDNEWRREKHECKRWRREGRVEGGRKAETPDRFQPASAPIYHNWVTSYVCVLETGLVCRSKGQASGGIDKHKDCYFYFLSSSMTSLFSCSTFSCVSTTAHSAHFHQNRLSLWLHQCMTSALIHKSNNSADTQHVAHLGWISM